MKLNGLDKVYEIQCNLFQYSILSIFNEFDEIEYSLLKNILNCQGDILNFYLKIFISKYNTENILMKKVVDKKIYYYFNTNFKNNSKNLNYNFIFKKF
jgi:hypothetical protein